MPTLDDLTALVVNFRTLDETRTCLETLRAAYPTLSVVVVDNGSGDASTTFLRELERRDEGVSVIFNDENAFHGPALHQGMHAIRTRYVFLLDSDCIVEHGGFLEPLLEKFDRDPLLYAVGKRGYANRYGQSPVDVRQRRTHYVHPFASVVDREKYLTLPPFVHHGAPLYRNMWGAQRKGYHLEHVTIEDHVTHLGKVTARRFGYGMNRRLRLQVAAHVAERRIRKAVALIRGRQLERPEPPPGVSS